MKSIIIFAIFVCFFLFYLIKRKEIRERKEFLELKLPSLIECMSKNKSEHLTKYQIHIMWHNHSPCKDIKKSLKYMWVTDEEIKKLHRSGHLEKRKVTSFEGNPLIEYSVIRLVENITRADI